jgi:hypothetical protein
LIYLKNNSAAPPCQCSALCRLACSALDGLHQALAPLAAVPVAGTFSVTEPVTMIDCWVSDVDGWGAVPAGSPLVGVLVATERGRARCCACSATRRGEATRVGPPGRVPRRSNRSGPGAQPAGQIIHRGGGRRRCVPQSGLRHILHRLRLDSARLIRLNLGDGGTRRRRRQWP